MLEKLREKNKNIKFYSVFDEEFRSFGRILDVNVDKLISVGEKIEYPEIGVKYVPTLEEFENLEVATEIKNEVFGTLPLELGYCWGHSSLLNATEWHTSSEVNIAVTPMVLLLAHLWDIKDKKIDSSQFTAFYVPKGVAIEVYATSTHYCPCQVDDGGFKCAVGLPKDTNTQLETELKDKLVSAKNKWIICHYENEGAKARGVTPGISGENFKIEY